MTLDEIRDRILATFGAGGKPPSARLMAGFRRELGKHALDAFAKRSTDQRPNKIYATELGESCNRKLWYRRHRSHCSEPMQPEAELKFLYGDIIEEVIVLCMGHAGIHVSGQQDSVVYDVPGTKYQVRGRTDAITEKERVVDVKSISSAGFNRLPPAGVLYTADHDTFGYRFQLSFYHHFHEGELSEPPAFLFVDKQLGKIRVSQIRVVTKGAITKRAKDIANVLESGTTPVRRDSQPDGKSGNRKLDIKCHYCPFKQYCWNDANNNRGLRTFLYSGRPTDLVEVVREPRVPELHPKKPEHMPWCTKCGAMGAEECSCDKSKT